MYSIQFWKSWSAINQRLFWAFSAVAFFSFFFFWFSEFNSPSPEIPVQRTQEVIPTSFDSRSFRIGAFELNVPADAFLVFERNDGGLLALNSVGTSVFLALFTAGIIGLLTVITTLPRFWFFTGAAFFTILVLSLRFESVILFGLANSLSSVIILVLYLIPLFYFGMVRTTSSFSVRLLVNIFVTVAAASLLYFFAGVKHPFLFIAANALIPGIVLTIIFLFMIAHEPLAALIAAISRGTKQTRSLTHFLIIGSIYLINLGIIYANRKYIIHWNYLPINLMVFASVSGILGVWGFRQRDPQFDGIIKANPFGVLLYLSIATIGFGSIGYFFATANDPVIRLAEDSILYSSLGYGIIFMIYVISNFGSMLYNNLQVYKILYQPENMPYFTFRLAGLICTIVFFAYSNYNVSLHMGYAGYYNAWGDSYKYDDNPDLALGYYEQATSYALRNYHGHYALAQLYDARGESAKEIKEYQLLIDSRPLDLAYLNLSHLTQGRNSLEQSMDILRLGLHDFPKNGRIENELALGFAAQNKSDSAFILMRSATKSALVKKQAAINLMALLAQFKSRLPADSLLNAGDADNAGFKSNALALACVQGSRIDANADPGKDTVLSVYQITTLHNALINQNDNPDTALVTKAISLAHQNENPYFRDFLLSGAAFAQYANGTPGPAIRTLREPAFAGQQEKYFNALGLWYLEQGAPATAVNYFDLALKQNFSPSFFNRAIALTEALRLPEAIAAWDSVRRRSDSVQATNARKMLLVLKAKAIVPSWTDEEKYLFARYRTRLDNIEEYENIVNAMSDNDWKAKSLLDRSKQLDESDDQELAYALLGAINGISFRDKAVSEEVAHLHLIYLAQQKKWDEIRTALGEKNFFAGKYRIVRIYLEALIAEQDGKKDIATRNFSWLLRVNPFFEDAVVEAIRYFEKTDPKSLQRYSALVYLMDLNPDAVKLQEEYAVMSLRLDFDEAGQAVIEKLKSTTSKPVFLKFLQEHPDLFEISGH